MKTQEDFDKAWHDALIWARKELTDIAAELMTFEPDHNADDNLEQGGQPSEAELDRLDESIKRTLHSLVDEVCVGWRAAHEASRETYDAITRLLADHP